MTTPYRPANGSEGMEFMERFCFNDCKKYVGQDCPILANSFWNFITDPDYPKEWVSDDDGSNPRCTAFSK